IPPRLSSRHVIAPEAGVTKPQMALNSVVLPAPLGPMMPSTSPLQTSSETPSRAVTPSKDTVISLTHRVRTVASPLATRASYTSTSTLPMLIRGGLHAPNESPAPRLHAPPVLSSALRDKALWPRSVIKPAGRWNNDGGASRDL